MGMTRAQHRAEAKRILALVIEQTRNAEPNSWTTPYLLMAQVHATLSLEGRVPLPSVPNFSGDTP